jgi:hypothetical protein
MDGLVIILTALFVGSLAYSTGSFFKRLLASLVACVLMILYFDSNDSSIGFAVLFISGFISVSGFLYAVGFNSTPRKRG